MTRDQEDLLDLPSRRRQTSRQVRHEARTTLHQVVAERDDLEDAVLPVGRHDVGRKASPAPKKPPAPGRRPGFKVWKTAFWKRRRQLWHERNVAARRVADVD